MLVSIKIQPNISCEYICQTLQKAIEKYSKNNDISDRLIIVDIQKISDDTSLIPKLEHKCLSTSLSNL